MRADASAGAAACLRTTVVNLCLDWQRRNATEQQRAPRLVERHVAPPEIDETWDRLAALPPDQRVTLVLRYYEDLSMGEIARLMGCPPATVRTRIHRAINYAGIWYPGWTTDNLPAQTETLQVTDGEAHLGSIAPGAGDLLQLWIVYDDGVVELQAAGMARDELIAAGNGVERTPATTDFALTPPAGYSPRSQLRGRADRA